MRALPHPRQQERIAALQRLQILDTPREEAYDEVVELVAELCEVPIAVINLIDEHRQWFKAEVGLGVRETPLETSICAHVILQPGLTVIPDTLADDRLRDNPMCYDAPNLRFYAGMCLETDDGLPVGTLCVLDTRPRDLSPRQRKILTVLGRQVMRQIELARALRQAAILRQEVDHRAKNSLAIVQSLLATQARQAGEPAVKDALQVAHDRISAIAEVHNQLQQSAQAESVELGGLLRGLADAWNATSGKNADIEITVPAVSIATDEAVKIGIVLNELVTNALKHATGAGQTGKISIAVERQEQRLAISVSDTGEGLPEGFDPSRGSGLGMRVVLALANDLGGGLDWTNTASGARFLFTAAVSTVKNSP